MNTGVDSSREEGQTPRARGLSRGAVLATIAASGIVMHLMLRLAGASPVAQRAPLYAVLLIGGVPLVGALALRVARLEFGSDLLAGISIVTAVLLGEYLAGSLVVLMLSSGEALVDKTGTLTYGRPTLTARLVAPGVDDRRLLQLAASLERYSKHPLAAPILDQARREGATWLEAAEISDLPGEGLEGIVEGQRVRIVGRSHAEAQGLGSVLPPTAPGLECLVLVGGEYMATYRFHDVAREDSRPFVEHLRRRHGFDRVLLVSGDRESEVRYLADHVGITDGHAATSPEEKVAITRAETAAASTLFIGDGINDAPALVAATVGVAFGHKAQVTAEAAVAVIMDTSLRRVDEFFHIGRRMRRIALQSAVGGMAVSVVAMLVALAGHLPPVAGAILQEVIDLAAVSNALRAAVPGGELTDY